MMTSVWVVIFIRDFVPVLGVLFTDDDEEIDGVFNPLLGEVDGRRFAEGGCTGDDGGEGSNDSRFIFERTIVLSSSFSSSPISSPSPSMPPCSNAPPSLVVTSTSES